MEYGYEDSYKYEKKYSYHHDENMMFKEKIELEVKFIHSIDEGMTYKNEEYMTEAINCERHSSAKEGVSEGCGDCVEAHIATRKVEVPYKIDVIIDHEYIIPEGVILVEPLFYPCRWTGVYWDYEMRDDTDGGDMKPSEPLPKDPPPPPEIHVTEETFNLHVYKNELMHDRQEDMIMVLFKEMDKMKIRMDFLESRVYNTPSPMEKPKFPDQIEPPKEPLNLLDSYMKGQSAILNPNAKEVKEDEPERDSE